MEHQKKKTMYNLSIMIGMRIGRKLSLRMPKVLCSMSIVPEPNIYLVWKKYKIQICKV